jgi:Flp pilus assembly pilin Flp
MLQRLLQDRLGVTAMEYALIAALIAVAAIAAFTLPARASARLSA